MSDLPLHRVQLDQEPEQDSYTAILTLRIDIQWFFKHGQVDGVDLMKKTNMP